jgi:hypothetical protein
MSSASAPFGLRPSSHPSGVIRPSTGTITSATAANIFMNQPVRIDPTTGDILPAGAGAGTTFVGVFQGVEYTNAQGRRTVSNWWPTGTVTQDTDGGNIVTYTQDPFITYAIQANGSVARTSLGAMGSYTAASGSTGTGLSTQMLDTATLADAADQMQIMGITKGPDNDWGDAFTIVDVQISQHQLLAARPAFA